MEDNVGTIVIGTKVNNKGLQSGLKETEKIVKDFDQNNEIKATVDIDTKKFEQQMKEIDRKIKNKEIKIDYGDNPEYVETAGRVWERSEAISFEKAREIEKANEENLKYGRGALYYTEKQRQTVKEYGKELENQAVKEQEIVELKKQESEELQRANELSNIELDLNTNPYDAKIAYVESRMRELEKVVAGAETKADLGRPPIEVQKEYSDLALQLDRLKEKQIEWNNETKKQSNILNQIKASGQSFENKLGGLAKKAGKLGLALIGIRTIMNLITRAFNILSQANTDLGNKVNNIKTALAAALEPLIIRIVHWLEILLSYVNVITKAFLGIDIFARGAELTNKMAKNMSSGASSAKEMRKQLAGFDEMNVLQDNDTSSGGGSGGIGDDAKWLLEEQPVAKWFKDMVQWVKENYKWLLAIAGVIAGIWALIKGMNLISKIGTLAGSLGGLSTTGLILLGIVEGLAILFGGTSLVIEGLQTSVENTDGSLLELTKSLGLVKIGLFVLSALNPFTHLLTPIADLLSSFYIYNQYLNNSSANITNLERAENNLKTAQENRLQAQENLKTAQDEYNSTINSYENAVNNAKTAQENLTIAEQEAGIAGEDLYNKVVNGELTYLSMDDTQKKVYKAYMNNVDAQQKLNDETVKLTEEEANLKNAVDEDAKAKELEEKRTRELSYATQLASGDFDGFKKSVVDAANNGEIEWSDASDYISQAMAKMNDKGRDVFTKDLPKNIKEGLDPSKYETKAQKLNNWFSNMSNKIGDLFSKLGGSIGESIWGGLKGIFNSAMYLLESMLNNVVWLINKAIPYINKLPGVNLERLSGFSLPRLAVGAIINQPGRGVPVGGAIAGEAGREGIIPLTDRQAMAELGKEIGKWINIQATVPVNIGNRQVARVIQELNNDREFAMNS